MSLNTAWAIGLVRGLATGVRHAWICPGSRSTPLALAVDAHPHIHAHVAIDERSAAFLALGAAKATQRPAMLVTTSGTAVAEALPAVVEAHQANVPLVIVTADRPKELRDTGANQTIDQTRIFAPYCRWEVDLPAPTREATVGLERQGEEAVHAAWLHPPGPVHVNVPLRKPLEPDAAGRRALRDLRDLPAAADHAAPPVMEDVSSLPPLQGGRGLMVVGPRAADGLRGPILALAQHLDIPVIADGLSDLRYGPDGARVVATADLFLSDAGIQSRLRPDWVLQFGAGPTSQHVRRFLARHGMPRYRVDESGRGWDDVGGKVRFLRGGAARVVGALLAQKTESNVWTQTWHDAEHAARATVAAVDAPGELAVVPTVLGQAEHLFVGNSLPVRDLERFGMPQDDRVRVWANRGASGIDGTIATAAGIGHTVDQVTAVIGDVAFQHDVSSLAYLPDGMRLVVIDNGGGRIFQHLPIADDPRFESLFLTPPSVDIGTACDAFGVTHIHVEPASLGQALAGDAQVVQVRTDGEAALGKRREAARAAVQAVTEALDRAQGDAQPS